MTTSPGPDRMARLIAENVASAVEGRMKTSALHPLMREALVIELLRALLPTMPTYSGAALVEACNRCLGHFAGFQVAALRVEAVDPADGSVTLMPG